MLRVLTGELSGLVEGGRPTKVTLLPSNPPDPFPGFGSFLRSSALQTEVQNSAQTVITRDENKVDSMVAVKRIFCQTYRNFYPFEIVFAASGSRGWMHIHG